MPKVSILTPCHNSALYLESCVQSVLDQEFEDWEHLILDDGSSDNSWPLLQKLVQLDSRIKVHRSIKNLGISKARNELISLSSGEYIAFLDSDDEMYPDRIKIQLAYLESNQNIDILGSNYQEKNHKRFKGQSNVQLKHREIVRAFQYMCPVPNPTLMARAGVMRKIGFDETFSSAEDLDFLIRANKFGHRFANLPFVTTKYLIHDQSASTSKKFEMQLNTYIAIKQVTDPSIKNKIRHNFIDSLYIRYSSARILSFFDQLKCLLVAPFSEIGRFFLWRRLMRLLYEAVPIKY